MPRVWVLDDSPAENEALRRALSPSCEVTLFSDGATLLETLTRQPAPDLMLLDWQLPGMSGVEVCRFLRGNPGTESLPVVLLTANTRSEDVAEGLAAGANDYIFKPFRAPELVARIHAQVRWERMRQKTLAEERARRLLAEGTLSEVQAAEERAWRSELRFRLAARATRDAVWEWDPRTDTVDWTGGAAALFGHEEREVRDTLDWWTAHIHPEDRERVLRGLRAAAAGTEHEWQDAYRFQRGDGTWAFVVDRCHIVRDSEGRAIQAVGAMQDNTEARLVEAERQRRADFERQLIGIVSHDLRNPLHAITLAASALLQRSGMDARQERHARRIQQAAERAARMIRDLLDFTRARQGGGIPVHPRPVDLRELVRGVVDELQPVHPDRVFQLEHEGDAAGEWDPDRLAQVLANLVGNAAQYSPPGTSVHVATKGEPDGVSVVVHNEGAPIPRELQPRIFEPLERGVRQEDRERRSIGLGLYIVRHIIQAHGGTVTVRSSVAEGTTFTVRLPRHAQATPEPSEQRD